MLFEIRGGNIRPEMAKDSTSSLSFLSFPFVRAQSSSPFLPSFLQSLTPPSSVPSHSDQSSNRPPPHRHRIRHSFHPPQMRQQSLPSPRRTSHSSSPHRRRDPRRKSRGRPPHSILLSGQHSREEDQAEAEGGAAVGGVRGDGEGE